MYLQLGNKSIRFYLSRDYLLVVFAFIFLLLISISLYTWLSYEAFLNNEKKGIVEFSTKVEHTLEDSFEYSSHLMGYLSSQIILLPDNMKSEENILHLLQNVLTTDLTMKKFFSWSLFDWINPNNQISSSVLKNHKNPEISSRDYIEKIRTDPFILHFSKPAIGVPSGKWIIPAAFGVKDNKNYLGAIGIGFDILNLQKTIKDAIKDSNKFTYAVINKNLELMLPSPEMNLSENHYLQFQIENDFKLPKNKAKFLNNPIDYKGFSFIYVRQMANSPFCILIGYNDHFRSKDMYHLLISKASVLGVMGCLLLILLFALQKIIVKPVIQLSTAAEKIILSTGTEEIFIPSSNIKEFDMLSARLIDLKNLILELKSQEDKINKINKSLEEKIFERTKQLEDALAIKTDFLNNMSHEIRTPIQGFLGISESLDQNWDQYSDAQRHSYMSIIARNANRLASLVGNLLDLTKFNDGKLYLDLRLIDFTQIIEELISECKTLYLQEKYIDFIFYHPENSIKIKADEERIIQVMRNIIFNSIKFSPNNGKIVISLRITEFYHENNKLEAINCSISDEGIGIPENELLSIFDPFIQSSRSKSKAGGTGLGLAICDKIIKAHNGKIWAENNINSNGATFHFIIPTNTQNNFSEEFKTSKSEFPKIKDIKNILVIDDEETILSTIDIILVANNFIVQTADGGKKGLEKAISHFDEIDLIFLDLMMPDMHGLEVLKILKNNPKTSDIPVIIQSGASNESEKEQSLALGAFSFISKPFNKSEILFQIQRLNQKL